jgi:hypothetical protein
MSNLQYSMGSAYYNGFSPSYTYQPAQNGVYNLGRGCDFYDQQTGKPCSQNDSSNNSSNNTSKKTYGYTSTKPRNHKSNQLDEYDQYVNSNNSNNDDNEDYHSYMEYLQYCENLDKQNKNDILRRKYQSSNQNKLDTQTNKKVYGSGVWVGVGLGLGLGLGLPESKIINKNNNTEKQSASEINVNQSYSTYTSNSSNTSTKSSNTNTTTTNTVNEANKTSTVKTTTTSNANKPTSTNTSTNIFSISNPISDYLIKPEYFTSLQQLENRYYEHGIFEKIKNTIKEINKRLEQNNYCDHETSSLVSEIYVKLDISCYHYTNTEKLLPCLRKIEQLHINYLNKLEDFNNNLKPIEVITFPRISSTNPFHIDPSLLANKSQLTLRYESVKYYNEIIKELIQINDSCEKKEPMNYSFKSKIESIVDKLDNNNSDNYELIKKLKQIQGY